LLQNRIELKGKFTGMKANEIRVGNIFIGYDDKLFSWGLKEFSFIEPDVNISIDEIIKSPVVVSEEILLKVGFEKVLNKYTLKTCDKPFIIIFLDNSFKYDDLRFETAVNNLHQLQNIYFALTGKELDTSNLTDL